MSIKIGKAERLKHGRAESELRWANVNGKKVFILSQKGAYADICYDHGRLLAPQVEEGVFPEIIDTVRTATDLSSDFLEYLIRALYRRFSSEVLAACSAEFRDGVEQLKNGFFEAYPESRFSAQDVRDALVAIDVGNVADGYAHRLKLYGAPEINIFEEAFFLAGTAASYGSAPVSKDVRKEVIDNPGEVADGLQRLRAMSRRVGFGCTGFGAAPGLTEDGRGLHARTFDGAFFDWNKWPGLFLIDERKTDPSWHRYVAIGTAGLTYSGGISGMNDAGIACSIHQMSTGQFDAGRPGRRFALAPYLQQRILREASSLEKAEKILKKARHFASWTIVVSDAKTGRAARFEINGGTQTVAKMELGDTFAQSNHFMAPGMVEKHDHFGDKHYTPTFGKWLETRARLKTVEAAMTAAQDTGTVGTDAAMKLLASHADGELEGAPRSFGRTICKAYGLMGSIARADPDRTRADDEIWMSVGNASPGPHADFVGFKIDWEAMKVTPVAKRPVRAPDSVSEDFARACADYVAAFETISRPRDKSGEYLGRDPSRSELNALERKAIGLLDKAVNRADDAGEMDFAFRYARGRLKLACNRHAQARDEFLYLKDFPGLHPWEKTLVLIMLGVAYAKGGDAAQAKTHLDAGATALAAVRKTYFPGRSKAHPDLDAWAKVIDDWRADPDGAEVPEFDFVTVE